MSAQVTLNTAAVLKRLESIAKDRLVPALANEVLKDSNYYCREDSGALIDSSILASRIKDGVLVWDTPYAKRVYYTGTPSTDRNSNASLMWAQKAASENRDKYQKMLQKVADGG